MVQLFQYIRPDATEACYAALEEYGDNAEPLAGGTDLLVAMKAGTKRPRCVVDLKALADVHPKVSVEGPSYRVSACTSMHDLATCLPRSLVTVAEAAAVVGSRQIRNRATLGGNIAQASPAAETVPALVALDATVELASRSQKRCIRLEHFFTGPHQTVRRSDELLFSVHIPAPGPRTSAAYLRFTPRQAMDIAVVNVAVSLTLGADAVCQDCRVVLGAVAPTVMRAEQAESLLRGERITSRLLQEAGSMAAREAKPINDVRASSAYRRELVSVLVQRAGARALERQNGDVSA